MVTVGQLIDALQRCDKTAQVPINMADGSIVWLSEIRIMNGAVILIAHTVKEAE